MLLEESISPLRAQIEDLNEGLIAMHERMDGMEAAQAGFIASIQVQTEALDDALPRLDRAHAIALANDSPYGLNGNVWTRDKRKGTELASRIETGACSVNDMAMSYGVPAAPFGGRKLSGVGQVNGETGVLGVGARHVHELRAREVPVRGG